MRETFILSIINKSIMLSGAMSNVVMLNVICAVWHLCRVLQITLMLSVVMLNVVMPNVIILSAVMPNVVMLNVVMPNVVMPNVIILNVIMLNVVMLNVILPNVIMPNVVMPNVVMPNVVMPNVVMPNVVILNVVMLKIMAPKIQNNIVKFKSVARHIFGAKSINLEQKMTKTKYIILKFSIFQLKQAGSAQPDVRPSGQQRQAVLKDHLLKEL
jgi:hypothetical protein